jgi:hypothetical protein
MPRRKDPKGRWAPGGRGGKGKGATSKKEPVEVVDMTRAIARLRRNESYTGKPLNPNKPIKPARKGGNKWALHTVPRRSSSSRIRRAS